MDKHKELLPYFGIAKTLDYKGSTDQIVTLSLLIDEVFSKLDASVFAIFKDHLAIEPKIFSKLKVIGNKLSKLDDSKRRDVVDRLPASYSTIHILCALDTEELVTAVKSEVISPSMSVREARSYITQIRYPSQSALDGEVGKWGYKQENLFNIVRPDNVPMSKDLIEKLRNDLRKVCSNYGAQIQTTNPDGATTLREQERNEKGLFWKSVLDNQLTYEWFNKTPQNVRKQFNIKTLEDLHESPIRTFTGFIHKADSSVVMGMSKSDLKQNKQGLFWEKYGQAYIAKIQMLSEITEDAGQRYNYRRRLEQVLSDKKELAIWNKLILKESGFV